MYNKIKKQNKQKQTQTTMTSVENLLTNSTNRFSPAIATISTTIPSSFTPLISTSNDHKSMQSVLGSSSSVKLLQPIQQTYSQLQARCKQLQKQLTEANKEKQLMTLLFEKVFMVEAGQQQRMKKRFRRRKTEIQGKYSCRVCSKIYSSSTSLARHAKLKHSYTMMEPPQHDYQIPPQPNSTVESCGLGERPEETEMNERVEGKECLLEESGEQESGEDSSVESCSSSESHDSTPFQKGLS